MKNTLKALWITFKWIRSHPSGFAFEAKSVANNEIFVIVQPGKSARLRVAGMPALCRVCNRINEVLKELESEPAPISSIQCDCTRPAHAIGQKNCVRCGFPHRVAVK